MIDSMSLSEAVRHRGGEIEDYTLENSVPPDRVITGRPRWRSRFGASFGLFTPVAEVLCFTVKLKGVRWRCPVCRAPKTVDLRRRYPFRYWFRCQHCRSHWTIGTQLGNRLTAEVKV